MAKQTINIGTSANSKDGDIIRDAFNKTNQNFSELYARSDNTDSQTLTLDGNTLSITGGNSVTLPSSGTANTDIYKFEFGVIGTKDEPDTGGWGGYNIVLDPGGESWAGMFIPSVATQDGSGSLNIYNNKSISNNITLSVNAGNITLRGDGSISYPGGVMQSHRDNTTCTTGVETVIYTATAQNQHAIKMFVMVEGVEEGGTGAWQTQACDIIAVKGYVDNIVHVTTYGVTYSSSTPLATFDGKWNAVTSRIEITCIPTSLTTNVVASVHAIELTSND